MKTKTQKSRISAFAVVVLLSWMPNAPFAQTTINLDERCDCEITRHTSEVTAGDLSPAGETLGDMLIDPSGDLFFWDGDSWEVTGGNDGDWTVNGNNMYNANSGYVGVGTSSPQHALHVAKSINDDYTVRIQNGGGDGYGLLVQASDGSSIDTSPIVNFTDFAGSSKFNVLGSGKVGIGDATPDNKLSVFGDGFTSFAGNGSGSIPDVSIYAPYVADGYRGIGFTHATNGVAYAKIASRHNGSGSWLSFGTSNNYASGITNQALVINPNGWVGVGTATPNAHLQVNGYFNLGNGPISGTFANSQRRLFSVPTGTGGGYLWSTIEPGNTQWNHYMHRHSTAAGFVAFGYGSSTVGTITTNGSSTSYNTTSDYRLKQNVTPLKGALEEIGKIKPASYQFKATPEITEAGFIAHELQEIYPQAVTGSKDQVDEEGNPVYQNVDYGKLTPLLTAGVQELQVLIIAQQREITVLKAELQKGKEGESQTAKILQQQQQQIQLLMDRFTAYEQESVKNGI